MATLNPKERGKIMEEENGLINRFAPLRGAIVMTDPTTIQKASKTAVLDSLRKRAETKGSSNRPDSLTPRAAWKSVETKALDRFAVKEVSTLCGNGRKPRGAQWERGSYWNSRGFMEGVSKAHGMYQRWMDPAARWVYRWRYETMNHGQG